MLRAATAEVIRSSQVSTGKSVAIFGGGPAGLTSAFYLALAGHACTVFESTAHLGGRLRDIQERLARLEQRLESSREGDDSSSTDKDNQTGPP